MLSDSWKYLFHFRDNYNLTFVQKIRKVRASKDLLKDFLCSCLLNTVCTFRYTWSCTTCAEQRKRARSLEEVLLTQICRLPAGHTDVTPNTEQPQGCRRALLTYDLRVKDLRDALLDLYLLTDFPPDLLCCFYNITKKQKKGLSLGNVNLFQRK